MRRTLELAERGRPLAAPNPLVGCLIVRDGRTLAEGWHRRDGQAHAEQDALAQLADGCVDADVYVNLEPCATDGRTPACARLLAEARPRRVVIAIRDPDRRTAGGGIEILRQAGIQVREGVLERQAAQCNRGYLSRQQRRRPFVRAKTASTLDGRICLPGGASRWITSESSRRQVHLMRASSCAVATGAGTVIADDPQLTAREVQAARQPLRVLFDSRLRSRPDARMFAEEGRAVIFTAAAAGGGFPDNVELVRMADREGRVDLDGALRWLAERRKCNEVLVEGGGGLIGALLQRDLIDEIVSFIAPVVFGCGDSLAHMPDISRIDQAAGFALSSVEEVGGDIKAVLCRRQE